MAIKTLYLLFAIIFAGKCCDAAAIRSFSSGDGIAPQTCGTNNQQFYCPLSGGGFICNPRSQRCTDANTCSTNVDPATREEVGCFRTNSAYTVKLGHAPLTSSSSLKKKLFEHRFVQYRGFTYKFGSSYGQQILDIGDPMYKYANGNGVNRIDDVGFGYCTWEDANNFINQLDQRYRLFGNNCQDFADALMVFLTTGYCTQAPSNRGRRQVEDSMLQNSIDIILQNCCCSSPNSTPATYTASKTLFLYLVSVIPLLL